MSKQLMSTIQTSIALFASCTITASSVLNDPTLAQALASYAAPIRYTKQGVSRFFSEVFSTRLYAEHFLPCSFMHLADFMRYAGTLERGNAFTHEVLGMFYNRLKETPYVNPYAFHEFLDQLDTLVDRTEHNPQELIETILIHLETLIVDAQQGTPPSADALKIHAGAIIDHVRTTDRAMSALRERLFQLSELALNKIIFDPREDYATWLIAREIGQSITEAADIGIFTPRERDDLLWSLTARYAHFLTLSGGELSPDTLALIKTELCDAGAPLAQNSPGHSPLMPTRRQILLEGLEEAAVKTVARTHGIITDSLLQ
jgi:hypothetical protein